MKSVLFYIGCVVLTLLAIAATCALLLGWYKMSPLSYIVVACGVGLVFAIMFGLRIVEWREDRRARKGGDKA